MKTSRWQLQLSVALLGMAALMYAIRLLAFPDPALHNEMWRFLVGDIAFLFVQVPLVSMVIDGLIRRREREETRHKLNMVIGAFFSETGQALLGEIAQSDAALPEVREDFMPHALWKAPEYARARQALSAHTPRIELEPHRLERLKRLLAEERSFLIGLLANQTLLEHETFTDLLWALTHLGEELAARPQLDALAPADSRHLAVDVQRAYTLLGMEWLAYLEHLHSAYPFLFSLALRTNPLDPNASVTVEG
ncbi:hypothetical protein EG835_00240 [bacterium]|nr:hypothetical protein [bacterium]